MTFDDIEAGMKFRYGYDKGCWITVTAQVRQSDGSWLCYDNQRGVHRVYPNTPVRPPYKRKVVNHGIP